MSTPSDEADKNETDVGEDQKVASSRAGKESDDEDGTYVGRTGSDDALDDEQSGAEARAQQQGN
ncbi:hypothetical protein AU196_08425 [Mycobacterium sp. IS-1742]|uniref:hypothetical protein n=1 Tax=Mycobacterium sp. IS-1742 TaxID=1772285 RepID=UPI00073FAA60|nr:hypothetical protein [Mycobacterium sp. IS-1742]KUI31874.1 hypothetical protein AU196_08425 [Mycobacterium sp. IS-1742]